MTDAEFIQQPARWPRWPYLPMKRPSKKGIECAFMYADYASAEDGFRVYLENPWRLADLTPEQVKAIAVKEYKTAEELTADGWRVD